MMETQNTDKEDLASEREKLISLGISKRLVNLLGIIPNISSEGEKKLVRKAIKRTFKVVPSIHR